MRSFIKNIFIGLVALTAVFGFALTAFAAVNIDSTEKYSQFLDIDLDTNGSEDFINWLPKNGGATVTNTKITGYIWGETVGWIHLDPSHSGVTNTCGGKLGGYAWGENTGWINFNPTHATIRPNIDIHTGEITGQVWSQNYGWIELASPVVGQPGLKTSWRPSGSCIDIPGSPSITVYKNVVGGTAAPSNFTIYIKQNGVQKFAFPGSSAGTTKGVNFIDSRTFNISESPSPDYTATFSGDCDATGKIVFGPQDTESPKTCTITNTFKKVDVYACKDSAATNYDPSPTTLEKNSLCIYDKQKACKDPTATNYNSNPTLIADNSLCNFDTQYACKDQTATNYDPSPSKVAKNSLCNYAGGYACKDQTAINYDADPNLQADNTLCKYPQDQYACKDLTATNYNLDPKLHADNTLCKYPKESYACKDPNANNYNPDPDLHSDKTLCKYKNDFLSAFKLGGGGKAPWWPMMLGLIGLASSAPGIVIRATHMLTTFVWGRKKIRGVVYDSNSKEPLDPVYVSVVDLATNQEVKNQLTDLEGRFGFVLPKGHYKITAGKTNYLFPSVKLGGRVSDEVYDRLYFGEPFTVENEDQVVSMNIPMDPLGTDWNQVEKHRTGFIQYLIKGQTKFAWLFNILFVLGFLASIMITYFYPTWWNYVMTGLYVVLGLIQVYGHGPIKAGKVMKGGQPLAYGIVHVWSAGLNREIAKRVVETSGSYYILVPKSDYFVTIDQKNQDGTYTKIFTSNVFHARNGVIDKSFDL
jgi:hypothetical protein